LILLLWAGMKQNLSHLYASWGNEVGEDIVRPELTGLHHLLCLLQPGFILHGRYCRTWATSRRSSTLERVGGYIYLVNKGRQGILCLLAVRDGVGVAT
jgi:hypothetical protein